MQNNLFKFLFLMGTSIFHKDLLNNYQIVNKPGVYLVRVAYTVTMKNFIDDDYPRLLVPLRVVTPENLSKIVDLLDASPVIPYSFIGKLFETGAIFERDVVEDALPIKGDQVLASFKYLDDGRLVCDHIEQLPREELAFIKADELLKFNSKLKKLIKMK